jgi:hypothetical protein
MSTPSPLLDGPAQSTAPVEGVPFVEGTTLPREHSIKKYYPCPKLIEVFADVILHIILVVVALTVIFQEQLSAMEHDVLTDEFKSIMGSVADAASADTSKMPSCNQKTIKYIMNTTKAMQKDSTAEHNKNLKSDNILGTYSALTIIVVGMAIVAIVNLRYRHCRAADLTSCHSDEIEWSHILTNNLVTLVIVGIFEAYFVFNIAAHYIPTSESDVKQTIFDRIEEDLRIVAQSDDSFVPPTLKSTHETFGRVSTSFALAIIVSIVCIYALSKMKRNHTYNAATVATYRDQSAGANRIYDAFSWLWASEAIQLHKTQGTREYAFDICRNRLILPIIGACGMFAGITFTYFTKISRSEQLLNERQAQRVVDQAMFTFNAVLVNVPKETRRAGVDSMRHEVQKAKTEMIQENASQKDIEKNNAAIVDKTYKMAFVSAGGCVGIVLIGMLMTYINRRDRAQPYEYTMKYLVVSVITFILGCSIAFLCEYGFLNGVIANYDGVAPAEVIKYTIDRFNDKLDTKECDDYVGWLTDDNPFS